MKLDLKKFEGTLPYASELFGIYQPLLGWKSRMTIDRLQESSSIYRDFTEQAISELGGTIHIKLDSELGVIGQLELPAVGGERMLPRVAAEIDSVVARRIADLVAPDKLPTDAEWRVMLDRSDEGLKNILEKASRIIVSVTHGSPPEPGNVEPEFPAKSLPAAVAYVKAATEALKAQGVSAHTAVERLVKRESVVLGYLRWLSTEKPDILDELFFRRVQNPVLGIQKYKDPLSSFGSNDLLPLLSPVGVVHLFQQYFFDLDTFLGPSVGHVWLAPGTTLELVEETTKRVLTERSIELSQDTTEKSETEEKVHDELSTAVREENKSDIKLGFSANARYHNGTFEAGANTDLSLDRSRSTSRETAQKHMRDQSQRVSSEIRKAFKSTFKTTSETTEKSGRRYVIENKTNNLINYELRKKMRQVAVQVQDIGTQLCWQVFVDDPGTELGLGQLVHIAPALDLTGLQPPPPLPDMPPQTKEIGIQFPFELAADSEGGGELDVVYYFGDDREYSLHERNDKIVYQRDYAVEVPPGYVLDNEFNITSQHSGVLVVKVDKVANTANRIRVTLEQVNFAEQKQIEMQLTVRFSADQAHLATLATARQALVAHYDEEVNKRQQEAYVSAARERIKLASQLRKRPFDNLRQEERVMVYRSLIRQLMDVGKQNGLDPHVTSELVRAMFDVDKMLYFVAPEWWKPREHRARQVVSPAQGDVIEEAHVVGWGDRGEMARDANYYITEESEPAPMGSSLGWLLQLDGDDLRNAFLNAPWVKAVIPIRPRKEEAALNWLELGHLAGTDGLDEEYKADVAELNLIRATLKKAGIEITGPVTLRHALKYLAHRIVEQNKQAEMPDPTSATIPTEKVYEKGFYPLQGSFVASAAHTNVFSQWVEVLPTDQVVALEYDASKHV